MRRVVLFAAALCEVEGLGDLQRARTKTPRNAYRAPHVYHMGKTLNGHLSRAHANTKPCHQWTPGELQQLQATVLAHREEAHDLIYKKAGDPRALRHATVDEHRAHWRAVNSSATGHPLITEMQRDGHCHEAVMWWIHHLSHKTRQKLSHLLIPTVPLVEWRKPVADEGDAAAHVYEVHYHPSSTCQGCHGGGLPWQDADVQPPPIPRQVNGNDRRRRCDEWYGAEEGGVCGPCAGIAGSYYGDLPDESIFPPCEVVGLASDIPESQRSGHAFPKRFAVEMRGADRWPRASPSGNASCNYTTDCEPYGKEGVALPPGAGFHWLANIHGVLYMDQNLGGHFSGGHLRHETVYNMPGGRKGAERALRGQFGEYNKHMATIHVQKHEQAIKNDPSVMLNMVHMGMDSMNKSGTDDSKLDWRRITPTPQNSYCVCLQDPEGTPDFVTAFENGTYLGRVSTVPQFQTIGTSNPPDGKPHTLDHWVKWFFHLWVDIDSNLPAMFTSPYGGMGTYGNWTLDPDSMWPEWRTYPTDHNNHCVSIQGDAECAPYTPPPPTR